MTTLRRMNRGATELKWGFELNAKMRAAVTCCQASKKGKRMNIYYYIDSVEEIDNEVIIAGWVVCADGTVDISLLNCQDYRIDRLFRNDVAAKYANSIQVNPQCGFEIRAAKLDLALARLKFTSKSNEKVVKIKESGIRRNKSAQMGTAYFNYQDILRGINYLSNYGFKATMEKIKQKHREKVAYQDWYKKHRANPLALQLQRKYEFAYKPLISIIVPVFNTPEVYLREMLQSVQNQTYEKWELCIADGSTDNNVYTILQDISKVEPRLKLKKIGENKGISGNSNEALSLAQGDYIALLDHDDLLTPDALFEVVKVLNATEEIVDLVYSDEDKTNEAGTRFFDHHFKPDFSIDFLRSNNYICHFTNIRKALLDAHNIRFDSHYDGAQDYDVIIRCVEKAKCIKHVARILYHWRAHSGSTSCVSNAKPYTHDAGKRVLQDHLVRCGIKGRVLDGGFSGELSNIYHIQYNIFDTPLISIIVPNCNHKQLLKCCIDSIIEKTHYDNYEIIVVENNSTEKDIFAYYAELKNNKLIRIIKWEGEFDYAAINNYAVKQCRGEYIVFLNNDVKLISDDWVQDMLGVCQRPDVGVVGAKLSYADDTIQHAGIVIGLGGIAGHCFNGVSNKSYGYAMRLIAIQDMSAVTGAFMMVKRSVFDEIGGFEKELKVAFNDVDLCLKVRQAGKLVVFNPYIEAYHYESQSRGSDTTEKRRVAFSRECEVFNSKWGDYVEPYYNANFSLVSRELRLKDL